MRYRYTQRLNPFYRSISRNNFLLPVETMREQSQSLITGQLFETEWKLGETPCLTELQSLLTGQLFET